jgi:hypothetical protein
MDFDFIHTTSRIAISCGYRLPYERKQVKSRLSVTPVYHYSFFVGYIPETQSIGLPPGQDDIHTLMVSSLVVIS